MSAQCWCYKCAGKVVTRKTFISHGRKNKPDEAIAPQPAADFVPSGESYPAGDGIGRARIMRDDHSSDSDEGQLGDSDLGLGSVEDANGVRTGRLELTSAEITVLLLDWMCTHKETDASAEHMWTIVQMMLPGEVSIQTWHQVKRILNRAQTKFVIRIEMCPNDCVVFWNSKHLTKPYRHAHRRFCPVCGSPRYLVDPKDNSGQPAKVLAKCTHLQ